MNGVTKHERRHSGFKLDLLTIVEKDVSVDHIIGFNKRSWLMPVDAFSLENREKVFSQRFFFNFFVSKSIILRYFSQCFLYSLKCK